MRDVRPDLCRAFHPWDRITEPAALRELLSSAGIAGANTAGVPGKHEIATPDAWWAAVLGSGYRGTIDQLDERDREIVRAVNLDYVARVSLRAVEANVVYATAMKLVP